MAGGDAVAGFAAVVLAGGSARRMGGSDKPSIIVAGRSMRDRVLDAVAAADPRVVVGGSADVPDGVRYTREQPQGGGPVAAIAAGLAATGQATRELIIVAGDLPLLTTDAVTKLRTKLSTMDAALFVDQDRRRQLLCGVWRADALRRRIAELGSGVHGASMRALIEPLTVVEVEWAGADPPPWFDCDTEDDLRKVREWLTAREAAR
ncbi:molybdenum cofactor guanylyltransferase [Asanoa sp. WMMD1127]|uniref:molybdenum cofactor guanylyltransferase n=1 Tax=Asanoa sp. WMMD1127 TaxID=3016107 RepID=UPI002415AC88|nr:molybdenum cofactor guanylyltransferase [Asanoa sp. WMMD1127]MDG4822110.1 molybdenum cofactor guanylyltransferase [Asanoa sp. WMMD1127]